MNETVNLNLLKEEKDSIYYWLKIDLAQAKLMLTLKTNTDDEICKTALDTFISDIKAIYSYIDDKTSLQHLIIRTAFEVFFNSYCHSDLFRTLADKFTENKAEVDLLYIFIFSRNTKTDSISNMETILNNYINSYGYTEDILYIALDFYLHANFNVDKLKIIVDKIKAL